MARPGRTSGRTRLVAVIVASALFMQNLDSTVIATALPSMARAFHADPVHMNVALTSYLLALAVFIPASGWMADRYGARSIFRAAIAVFTLGSILCGLANSLEFLVAARVVQGMGGAMMVPVGRLVLLRTVPKSELVAAMSWVSMPGLLGPVIGPPLGGLIVTYASWRWIFDINIPIGVIGMVMVTLFIEQIREPEETPFDGWGLVFSGIALASVMFALETIGTGLLPRNVAPALLALGIASAVAYVWHARRRPGRPLIDFTLFRLPTFLVSTLGGTLFRIGIGALPFLLPMMLQLDFGYSASSSGGITFVGAVGSLVMKPAAQWALRRFGFRDTLMWNGLVATLFLAACAAFRPGWPLLAIYALLLAGGVSRSLQFTSYNTVAYADVPRPQMSAATSLYSTIQQLSMTLGVMIGAAALEVSSAMGGHAIPSLKDFSIAFLLVSFFAALASPVSFLMAAHAGAEMSGHALPMTGPAHED